jgi:hypothetical protein
LFWNEGILPSDFEGGRCNHSETGLLKVTHSSGSSSLDQGLQSTQGSSGFPHSKTWTAAWHKIQDPWNQAYVEVMATYALSKLRIQGISPHFNYYYGSFCARLCIVTTLTMTSPAS